MFHFKTGTKGKIIPYDFLNIRDHYNDDVHKKWPVLDVFWRVLPRDIFRNPIKIYGGAFLQK